MHDLAGRTAIVTGASRGLGLLIARTLAAKGMRLVLAARSTDALEAARQEIERTGTKAVAVTADVTRAADREKLVACAIETFGSVDVLVNNAGSEAIAHYECMRPAEIEAAIQTNLIAPMLLSRHLLPTLLERRAGHIVNIASMAGKASFAHMETYTASKAGLVAFTAALRASYRSSGVSASAICPGFTDEGMFRRLLQKHRPDLPTWVRLGTAEAVASAVVRAILQDQAEVLVTPRPVRPYLVLAAMFPGLGERIGDRSGLNGFMGAVAQSHSVAS